MNVVVLKASAHELTKVYSLSQCVPVFSALFGFR